MMIIANQPDLVSHEPIYFLLNCDNDLVGDLFPHFLKSALQLAREETMK